MVNSVAYRGDDKHNPKNPDGVVMLHPLFIKSLLAGHFLCLNFSRFGTLTEAITQALYKRLYFHFSNIHQDYPREAFPVFRKAYDDICADWLSGLTVRKHRSKIIDQLGRHLEQLKTTGLLSWYDIVPAKGVVGFNLECLPGNAFFEDYLRFYKTKLLPQPGPGLRLLSDASEASALPESELVTYFCAKKYGAHAGGSEAVMSPADLEFARMLLAKHPVIECRAFIDFALGEARTTNFDVRSLKGLMQYHGAYLAKRAERARVQEAEEARRKQEDADLLEQRLQAEYETFKHDQIDLIRASFPSSKIAELEEQARAELRRSSFQFKAGVDRLVQIAVADQLASEHGVPSFAEWKAARAQGFY